MNLTGGVMLKKVIAIATVSSVVMLGVLLMTTTPLRTGPLGILALFVFMYIAALGVLSFAIWGMSAFVLKALPLRRKGLKPEGLTFRKAYYYASVIALAPIMLVAMQSVGEIGIYQILLVLFFVIIAWMYVTNRAT